MQRYYPFGEVRDLPNDGLAKISATDFGYTGQRALDAQGNSFPGLHGRQSSAGSLGLMDYKARFYDSSLGRFTQPDNITPGGPQGLNRYSYVLNNPSRYTDPTGHRNCEEDGYNCPGSSNTPTLGDYGVTLDPNRWDTEQKKNILDGIDLMAQKLWSSYSNYCYQDEANCGYNNREELYFAIFGSLTVSLDKSVTEYSASAIDYGVIKVYGPGYPLSGNNIGLLTHELGHKFDSNIGARGSNTLLDDPLSFQPGKRGVFFNRSIEGYQQDKKPFVYHTVNSSDGNSAGEDFADEFYNWVYQGVQSRPNSLGFANNDAGNERYNWINSRMGIWIYLAAGG